MRLVIFCKANKERKHQFCCTHKSQRTKDRKSFTFFCFASVCALAKGKSQNKARVLQRLGSCQSKSKKLRPLTLRFSIGLGQTRPNPTRPDPTKGVAKCWRKRTSSTLTRVAVTSAPQKRTKKRLTQATSINRDISVIQNPIDDPFVAMRSAQ